MRILISGASGFIGGALIWKLQGDSHEIFKLVRRKEGLRKDEVFWDPALGEIDARKLEGFDAVIHLAGESIVGRWTPEKKRKIRDSRVKGTELLSRSLARLSSPPSMLLCASAIGFYGNRGEEELDEDSGPGRGFLAETCQAWEAASQSARDAEIRVVHYRIGLVLSSEGGALQKMLPLFKLGLGGKLGNGQQWMSWISLEDLIEGMVFVLKNASLAGPVNAVAPRPVTNAEFTRALGKVLGRPTFASAPEFALKIAMGEMAEEALLASAKAAPKKLTQGGFKFQHPEISGTLRHILKKA